MRRLKNDSGPWPGDCVSKPHAAKISVVGWEGVLELLVRDRERVRVWVIVSERFWVWLLERTSDLLRL